MAKKELTETERLFLNVLMSLGLEKGLIVGIMLMLKKEEQMEAMVDFIEENIYATPSQLLQVAVEISDEENSLEEN